MLPSILAKQLQKGIGDYIETTFPMTNEPFQGSIRRMLDTPDAVFHEPYTAVRLPFRVAERMPDCFEAIHPVYRPYVHQLRAFERLTGDKGQSTLVATGTGSGKTECFLYPILEYCYQRRRKSGEKGVKALIIYPMNALAADQAKRIAQLIYNSPELRGNVTAGMYVGGREKSPARMMGESGVITDRETMLNNPPDILLTNYKMLDYLLVRPKDAMIWQDNGPYTLKYVAVDEFHTFDGAQGTDLACLLRRLKKRLNIGSGYLCCVGTSATMGGGDSAGSILHYASEVFDEPFAGDSLITEERLTPAEFFAGMDVTEFSMPDAGAVEELHRLAAQDDEGAYLRAAAGYWLESFTGDVLSDEGRIALGQLLMHHSFVQSLIAETRGAYFQASRLAGELQLLYPALSGIGAKDELLYSLLALISHARTGTQGKLRPFLFVQVQLWMRELRRLLAKVTKDRIVYATAQDLNSRQARQCLPVVNCRDCGATGWVTKLSERNGAAMTDPDAFYNLYVQGDDSVAMLFPYPRERSISGMIAARICPNCMKVRLGEEGGDTCPVCDGETVPVQMPSPVGTTGSRDHRQYVCPCCGSKRGLALVGLRSATEISVGISQLFASHFNDDKKTLAFSDNVQDAAHRAGFFNGKTWRFGLRRAMQRYVQDGGAGQSLAAFSEGFLSYWHQALTNEAFVSLFIAPNMTWMRAYEQMKEKRRLKMDRLGQKLVRDIEHRVSYEILLEYGMGGRLGRTLEKSGCSVLAFQPAAVERIAQAVGERTVNELGILRSCDSQVFGRMVIGYLHIMRSNGAFDDPAFYGMVQNDGNTYLLDSRHVRWMPGRQSGRNTPRHLVSQLPRGRGRYLYDTASARKYSDWVASCCDQAWEESQFDWICGYILEEAVKEGVVTPLPSPDGYTVYGLNKDRVYISDQVLQLRCGSCGSTWAADAGSAALWRGAPCRNRSCAGTLREDASAQLGYYASLYRAGDMARVNARDHTGLLERNSREQLETDFKRGRDSWKLWDPNVLSCTPTLEMGIDIGDLSTVILCSVPPAQAQFLQRAGRAGRKDGNALTLTVANTRPHDLFFYAEPMDMIAGEVQSPKIFLRASAVLERQFVAYCMDTWVKTGAGEQAIPQTVDRILGKLESPPPNLFPFNFLHYVQEHLPALLGDFLDLFAAELDDTAREELRHFAQPDGDAGGSMHHRILNSFQSLKRQRDALRADIQTLAAMIEALKAKPKDSSYDEEIQELESERIALQNVYREINKKDVFNFLSDEGLLPNYAFPESGILLKAILTRWKETGEEKDIAGGEDQQETKKEVKPEKIVYEYLRGASSAIREFAPMNHFYANGRKLTVDQVDLTTAQQANWRLCPSCAYAQMEEAGRNAASCPRCGDPAWADSGQVHAMLRFQTAYSHMDYTKSMISDERDDRSHVLYTMQLLVDVDEDYDIAGAFEMNNDEFPFGYEFVRKAVLREINFGESALTGEKLTVAGVESVRSGFNICKYCGTVQSDWMGRKHSAFCKIKRLPLLESAPFEENLFLYRQFQTELLRLLIPATTMDASPVRRESFIAAFMLGMKEYFGNVDHLRTAVSEFPVPGVAYRKQYLVIYDSVPGGTGYLKQLMHEKDALAAVFERALAVLETCSCKEDPQKDGCYHCLYAYRQSQKLGDISRSAAIRMLKAILSGRNNVERIDRLGRICVNPLFDSELERRFVEAVKYMETENRKVSVSEALVNGKEGYILSVNGSTWEMEPQVTLDTWQGVCVKCKPDFVIWPMNAVGRKPVAIFTDGFHFHKDSAADDTLKRMAICRSGAFRVWTLSWRDVQSAFQAQGDYATNTLNAMAMPYGPKMYQPTVAAAHAEGLHPDRTGPLALLMRYLAEPEAEALFAAHARACALSILHPGKVNSAPAYADWESVVSQVNQALPFTGESFEQGQTLFGVWTPRRENIHFRAYAGIPMSTMQRDRNAPVPVCAVLDDQPETRTDKFECEWNGLWQFFNVMQFHPSFAAVSQTGLEKGVYLAIPIPQADAGEDDTTPAEGAWAEIYGQLFDSEAVSFAQKLCQAGVPVPDEVGYEAVSAVSGEVTGMAELAWTRAKIAYLTQEQRAYAGTFAALGWTVIDSGTDISGISFGGEKA